MARALPARAVTVAAVVALLSWSLAAPTLADTPSPSPTPTTTSAPTATPTPTVAETPDAPPAVAPQARADAVGSTVTLSVTSVDGPVPGAYYEDLGSYGFAGTTDLADGTAVTLERKAADGTWGPAVSTTVSGGAYAAKAPVQAPGDATFRAHATGTEGADVTSAPTTVPVLDASVELTAAMKVDALKDLPVTGAVVPARGGVEVRLEIRKGSAWTNAATVTTAGDGTYATALAYGTSKLKAYDLRASYVAVNRPRTEASATLRFTRVAVLDPQVDPTTDDDVAKTYRKGCPVGPSKLSTIHLNYYGRDKDMHRGVIIVRTDLRQEIIRAFDSALEHRYPIAKMNNPDVYGGKDPKQMKANNTSGFNCRKVVGNPYKMSPHSYGIAIDVNTVQNPYRDRHGKWWPSNGKKYRDRSPLRWGMLGKKSWLTKSLRSDDFFWGGLWNPGRDYQHFEYRG